MDNFEKSSGFDISEHKTRCGSGQGHGSDKKYKLEISKAEGETTKIR